MGGDEVCATTDELAQNGPIWDGGNATWSGQYARSCRIERVWHLHTYALTIMFTASPAGS
jgi:hypothetical protein